jgi:hypothetical protein
MIETLAGLSFILIIFLAVYLSLSTVWGYNVWGYSWLMKIRNVLFGIVILLLWVQGLTAGFKPGKLGFAIVITTVFLLVLFKPKAKRI